MQIISWNVAGINACIKKGLLDIMKKEAADVYCFQEVKAQQDKLPQELKQWQDYRAFHAISKKKGYSGVSVYTKQQPLAVIEQTGEEIFDDEGRVLVLEFPKFFLINAYFPHAHRELTRLPFKQEFNATFLRYCKKLESLKPLIIAADFNVAHTELDLANPKQNKKNAGFTEGERAWFDAFLKQGFIDTFRQFTKDGGHYTWWTYRNDARARNIGWRIDYFAVSQALKDHVSSSTILKDIKGSDHCPILLRLS